MSGGGRPRVIEVLMSAHLKWRFRFGATGKMAALVLPVLLAFGIPKSELECEEAVARLDECCPERVYGLNCTTPVCGSPAISVTALDYHCISRLSCVELSASGLCERAQAIGNGVPDAGAICP